MARLLRSRSCSARRTATNSTCDSSPHSPSLYLTNNNKEDEEEDDDDEDNEEGFFGNNGSNNLVTTPLISQERPNQSHHQFPIMEVLVAALRKSLVTCSVECEDVASSMDISWPTDVRHVSHVTFDRFVGFVGLPVDLEVEVSPKVPSASREGGMKDCT
ncbi:unnamed protein product [Ilex paraguariensis]|uniref:CRIB domain-containing protein n=1 Tax=Ilex paraguariensis TaxID=185542 RepID=A0ABC8TIC7_9AQUA